MEADIIGYIGVVFLSCVTIPQIWMNFRRKEVHLSLYFIVLNLLVAIDFVIYAILQRALPLLIAEAVFGVGVFIVLLQYFFYKEGRYSVETII